LIAARLSKAENDFWRARALFLAAEEWDRRRTSAMWAWQAGDKVESCGIMVATSNETRN
jgi:hypothetical protein